MSELQNPDPSQLYDRITAAFPELAGLSYQFNGEGWDHYVLILNNQLVFRFPDDAEYLTLLRDEIRLLQELKPLVAVSIPQYTYIAPDQSFAGYPIVQGETLTADYFKSLDRTDQSSIAQQLAGLLSTLHTLVAKGHDLSYVPWSTIEKDQAMLKEQVEQYLTSVLSEEELSIVYHILKVTDDLLLQQLPKTFNHGDIYHSHLLWDQPLQQLGVIDFSDRVIGDPAFDFAELYEYGEEFVRAVYGNYTGPKDKDFLARAWIYQGWVAIYMMTDHFLYHKTSFEIARETFDRIKDKWR